MALTGNDAMSNACKSSGGPVATRPHTLYSRNPRDEMDKRRPAVSRGASASLVDRFHCCFTLFSKKADFFFFLITRTHLIGNSMQAVKRAETRKALHAMRNYITLLSVTL